MAGVADIPILRASIVNLSQELLALTKKTSCFSQPPFFTEKSGQRGILRRKCTNNFKIRVIGRTIRHMLSETGRMRKNWQVSCAIGFTQDEARRKGHPPARWETLVYPLRERGMTTADCRRWLLNHGYTVPVRSACTFCPYRYSRPDGWAELSDADRSQAIAIDTHIRHNLPYTTADAAYVHPGLQPLERAVAQQAAQAELDAKQLMLWDSNGCESGYCFL